MSGYGYTPASNDPLTGLITDGSGNLTGLQFADGSTTPVQIAPPSSGVNSIAHMVTGHTQYTTFGGETVDAGIANRRGNVTYQGFSAGSGTVQVTSGIHLLWLTGMAATASQIVQMAASPQDGDQIRIASQGQITSLTVQDASGNQIVAGLLMPSASQAVFLYSATTNTWTMIQQPAAVTALTATNVGQGTASLNFGTLTLGATKTVSITDARVHAGNIILVTLASGQAALGSSNPVTATCTTSGTIVFSLTAALALSLGTVNVTYVYIGN